MHVSLCAYCTIRVLISKTLTGTYEGGYTYVFEMCCYRTLDIVIYIYVCVCVYIYILLLLRNMYISVKTLKTLNNYAVMLSLVSDVFPMLIFHS